MSEMNFLNIFKHNEFVQYLLAATDYEEVEVLELFGKRLLSLFKTKTTFFDIRRAARLYLLFEFTNAGASKEALSEIKTYLDEYPDAHKRMSNLDLLMSYSRLQDYDSYLVWRHSDERGIPVEIYPHCRFKSHHEDAPHDIVFYQLRGAFPKTRKTSEGIVVPASKLLLPFLEILFLNGIPYFPALNGTKPWSGMQRDYKPDYSDQFDFEMFDRGHESDEEVGALCL